MGNFIVALLLHASLLLVEQSFVGVRSEELFETCSLESVEKDPALKEFTYDVGDGPRSFMAYVEPDINKFYQSGDGYSKVKPKFNGLAGKFINMSNRYLNFYWESYANGPKHLMRHYQPFSTGGTGTFPAHRFIFTPKDEPDKRLITFVVKDYPENLYIYDPYLIEDDPIQTEKNLQEHLNEKERAQYDKWVKTLRFNEQYKNFTGRTYLANFGDGPRKPPSHFMWRADHFGQEHWVTTKETHFDRLPPPEELGPVTLRGSERVLNDSESRNLVEYRVKDENNDPIEFMNMTLKVMSVSPRVFEIKNFLSTIEISHILDLAGGITLSESTTGDVGSNAAGNTKRVEKLERTTKVRTSKNSWVSREKSTIVDAIYRRAADLTRIDEALLRQRGEEEVPHIKNKRSLSETLQLVHYDVSQEYTAHHDFGYSAIDDNAQGARFATILFYLNDDLVGGETAFPRWQNGESFRELKAKPEAGKAILFYSQLPDGNMDDFSQHAAKPVLKGEKWLINLWIWDPVYS